MFGERRYGGDKRSRGRIGSGFVSVPAEPVHSGVVLMARDTSEPCLAAWLSTHLALAAANGVQKGGRDQTALGSLLRNKSEHACTVGRLPEAYFRNVVVTRTKDLRVFQHITRTGLLVRKNLNDSDWYAFGQTLLGIDADGAAALRTRPSLLQQLYRRFQPDAARDGRPTGFRWWTARNPQCVRPAPGSVEQQALERGWLPPMRHAR
jgi:hypothetical protein